MKTWPWVPFVRVALVVAFVLLVDSGLFVLRGIGVACLLGLLYTVQPRPERCP